MWDQGGTFIALDGQGVKECELERVAGGREVVRVNLFEHPRAAGLPVRSVPAAIAVGADGHLRAARAGRLEPPDLSRVLAAL
jgi:hypothetical protein